MLDICFPGEQFEEYDPENHIFARALDDRPIVRIGLFRPPVKPI